MQKIQQNLNLYATGLFNQASGSIPVSNIAKWNGTAWSTIASSFDLLFGQGRALEIYKGDLYVGGDFLSAHAEDNTSNFAIWNGAQWLAAGGTVFNANIGNDADVHSLKASSDGSILYIGGNFNCIGGGVNCAGGITANHLAQWNGTLLSPLPGSPQVRQGIYQRQY